MDTLVDESIFRNFVDNISDEGADDEVEHNVCPLCSALLVYVSEQDEQSCNKCGLVRSGGGRAGVSRSASSGCIRVSTNNRTRVYGINNGDNSRTQHKTVVDLLNQIDTTSAGPKIPKEILSSVASVYNDIQRATADKPFVRRGSIRREVLAAILFFKCIEMGSPRRKRDIALYMQLRTYGFCRGEQIVRNLVATGVLVLNVDADISEGFASRYLAMLGIDKKYENFVNEFIERTEDLNVGMSSQTSSKVAGVVWILIKGIKLDLTREQVEKATGGCKQNTYMKYCNMVSVAAKDLEPIFTKYEVEMNFGAHARGSRRAT